MNLEFLEKLWPYIERGGTVAAVLMSVAIFLLLKDRARLVKRLESTQDALIANGTACATTINTSNAQLVANTAQLKDNTLALQGMRDILLVRGAVG